MAAILLGIGRRAICGWNETGKVPEGFMHETTDNHIEILTSEVNQTEAEPSFVKPSLRRMLAAMPLVCAPGSSSMRILSSALLILTIGCHSQQSATDTSKEQDSARPDKECTHPFFITRPWRKQECPSHTPIVGPDGEPFADHSVLQGRNRLFGRGWASLSARIRHSIQRRDESGS